MSHQAPEPVQQSTPAEPGHGNTPAAWTGTVILLVASALISLGMVLGQSWMWIVGVVGVVAGVVVWAAMNRMGFNQEKPHGH
ncbi:HGxxPAAW family protein [Dermatophilus congolensis]|uniref:Uncharacterized protein n=1 Tax=Dermatophilus congolensis TaxID=1863 RepID=A0A239VNJ1_9MICO|nr:HGxxPAAW family protein [Dermatophilus congolensis]MBO3129527.1 hypothetical protein [Dermatophilus congolensis]MBO3131840.1 hypothetical protein [Dermatophilus congolensis]MBO3134003.1 hypothetical protein [Dermatophilus congolensis]MBO3136234.1 hypothetical protein [Dermatophilus congolensis]MBO3138480.1 hypothetical protein [Dermatophilus congolensis]